MVVAVRKGFGPQVHMMGEFVPTYDYICEHVYIRLKRWWCHNREGEDQTQAFRIDHRRHLLGIADMVIWGNRKRTYQGERTRLACKKDISACDGPFRHFTIS
jgi:hypothetical protein